MSVAIVSQLIGDMLVEVLDLGQKRYMELLSENGKSHLLRDMID